MLFLEECREHLPETEQNISDKDLTRLRDQIHGLAELALEDYFKILRSYYITGLSV